MEQLKQAERELLGAAGALPEAIQDLDAALAALNLSLHPAHETMPADSHQAQALYRSARALLDSWPAKPSRDHMQAKGAETVQALLRRVRNSFAGSYARVIYERITDGYRRFVRAEEVAYAVADICPGLCPTRAEVEAELCVPLAHKEGVEIAQGDFFSHLFACRDAGLHLVQGMLRPLPESEEYLARLRRDGRLDLGTVQVERKGALGCIYFNNPRYLNAEDDVTLLPLESAIDVVLLDADLDMGLLRGNPVQHARYPGRRIFSSGMNLSHLYEGRLSFMFYLTRDLGLVNKVYRGMSCAVWEPDAPEDTLEKPWAAVVEGFAIGAGCQILLVVDYVIAEEGAYCNLPARKEGIVPGAAPLRLSRFLGERQAQAGILFGEPFPVDSAQGRALVNEVVPATEVDAAIERMAAGMAGSGVVSAGANRKAMRVASEPLDLFRQYMSLYSRVQADCHFSPTLVKNLEHHWLSRRSRLIT